MTAAAAEDVRCNRSFAAATAAVGSVAVITAMIHLHRLTFASSRHRVGGLHWHQNAGCLLLKILSRLLKNVKNFPVSGGVVILCHYCKYCT